MRTVHASLLILLLGAALSLPAFAGGGFNDKSIKGTWSLFVRGHTAIDNFLGLPPDTSLVAVATITFDGRGGCSSVDQLVAGGLHLPSRSTFRDSKEGGSCSYSVNPDGIGFFDLVFPGFPATEVTFVISNRDQIQFLANNPELGIFGGGEMNRQSKGKDKGKDKDD